MLDTLPLAHLPLLADGAVSLGLRTGPPDSAPTVEALNQLDPERVAALHRAFATAGARLLRTNTAHATALELEAQGLADRAEAINNSGSALARRALGGEGFVMGTLGCPQRPGAVREPEWERAQSEQIIYLSDTEVDFFLLNHFARLGDALVVTERIKGLSDAPVLAALRLNAAGRTEEGQSAAEAAAALADAGADALGLSCGPGPEALPACVEALLRTGLPVAVLAGLSAGEADAPYPGAPALDPAAFAAWLAPLAGQGVSILGGCCGATPAHIHALAQAVRAPDGA
ncbi:MAG TPA: homocysteine S-methyltransferase family protein [bacterium]|nr:homocysteine S-methyltransferase family protein [bacterium]